MSADAHLTSAARAAASTTLLDRQDEIERRKREKEANWIPNEKGQTRVLLRKMTQEQRQEFFIELDQKYCFDCGAVRSSPDWCPKCDEEIPSDPQCKCGHLRSEHRVLDSDCLLECTRCVCADGYQRDSLVVDVPNPLDRGTR